MSGRHQPENGADSDHTDHCIDRMYEQAGIPIKTIKTEVLTPTWVGIFRVYVDVLRNPDADVKAQTTAMFELQRMALAADKWNEYIISQTPNYPTAHEGGDLDASA